MLNDYDDIRNRIAEPPKWWDEHGVPRYCDFGPREFANIYANEGVLLEIACQGCSRQFHVAITGDYFDHHTGRPARILADIVKAKEIHYGDPPNTFCCPAGPTMNSLPQRVLEFWRRDYRISLGWQRDRSLEIDVSDGDGVASEPSMASE